MKGRQKYSTKKTAQCVMKGKGRGEGEDKLGFMTGRGKGGRVENNNIDAKIKEFPLNCRRKSKKGEWPFPNS